MEDFKPLIEQEPTPGIVVAIPVSEVLQNPTLAAELWPQESIADPLFLTQINEHKEHSVHVAEVMKNLPYPTMQLETATKLQFVSDQQTENLYVSLSSLLADPDYSRLVLYLPFEFLPGRTWTPEDPSLARAVETFRQSYLVAWQNQLLVHDARANFVDGDIMEIDQRTTDLPRVVKAAHLVPKLIEYGMLETNDVIDLLASTQDPLLQANLTDSFLVLDDMHLIADDDLRRMKESESASVYTTAQIIESERENSDSLEVSATLESLLLGLEAAISKQELDIPSNVTWRRMDWLRQKQADEALTVLSEQVMTIILDDITSKGALVNELFPRGSLANQVFVEGVQKAIEQVARSGQDDPQALFVYFKDALFDLWNGDDLRTKERLVRSFRHLHKLGIVDEEQLKEVGIPVPNLAGPLSENLALIADEVEQLKKVALSMEWDPELAPLVYPVVTIGGSRLKGYGEQNSDVDICVFVKPNVPQSMKEHLRELLRVKFNGEEAMEFWLEENDGHLSVHDFPEYDPHAADSYWTHVLFGAAWVGNSVAVNDLRKKLLPTYFRETDEMIYGRTTRNLYLERMEQDLLQYRLLHKGYDRHYPRLAEMNMKHADLIDGNTAFWDPGFRQIATRLFVSQVFLPKIG